MAVIDASVYIALINAHEDGHDDSWAWLDQTISGQEPVVAPVILLAEVATALSRGMGDAGIAHHAIDQLRRSEVVELVPISLAMAESAATIAADHRIRGCDAVYVALADQLGECLVTLDRQQLLRGGAVVTTQEP
jgi:predicted nucleic acid-binding protein